MSRPLTVLRPEPGNEATARRIEALGYRAIRLPLFGIVPLAWDPPEADGFDAVILTSANAVRHAGAGLEALAGLPVFAVGTATAAAAREHGLDVKAVGTGDAAALMAEAGRHGVTRALHLGGRETVVAPDGIVARTIAVYASEPLPISTDAVRALHGTVALVHSPRAGERLGELAEAAGLPRIDLSLAAISEAAAAAAGPGWRGIAVALSPDDAALIAAAARLAD